MTADLRRQPELEFVAHVQADLGPVMEIGTVPVGRRRVIPIIGGKIAGPRLTADIVDGGADWQVVAADGTAIIDTRYSARTDSGDVIYLSTQGFRHGPADVVGRLAAGEDVSPDEYYFRITARLESGAAALDWVNRTVFVASAARHASSVSYDLYAIR
jgi:Protein of unknown function (DUF3237)